MELLILIFIFVAFIVYFLPSIIAYNRPHPNRVAICVLNILLGWTFLGWVAALVWALTAQQQNVIVTYSQPPTSSRDDINDFVRKAREQ